MSEDEMSEDEMSVDEMSVDEDTMLPQLEVKWESLSLAWPYQLSLLSFSAQNYFQKIHKIS